MNLYSFFSLNQSVNQSDLIYRIEDAECYGMYRGEYWEGLDDVKSGERHPAPHNDSKLLNENPDLFHGVEFPSFGSPSFIFGFSSPEQLRNWIYWDEWFVALSAAGYRLSIYRGDVRHGYTQAVIDKNTAELLGSYDLVEFFVGR